MASVLEKNIRIASGKTPPKTPSSPTETWPAKPTLNVLESRTASDPGQPPFHRRLSMIRAAKPACHTVPDALAGLLLVKGVI
jgi:hypothetical protein